MAAAASQAEEQDGGMQPMGDCMSFYAEVDGASSRMGPPSFHVPVLTEDDYEASKAAWKLYPPLSVEERRKRYHQVMKLKPYEKAAQGKGVEEQRSASWVHEVAAINGVDELKKLLQSSPVDVDERDRHGQTALHHAVWFGALDCVAVLLAAGWDPSVEDSHGRGVLEFTCAKQHRYFKPDASNNRDGLTAEMRRHSQLNHCAILLLLLLYGAPCTSKSRTLKSDPLAAFLLGTWESLSATVKLVNGWEPREADLLRGFPTFLEAVSVSSAMRAPSPANKDPEDLNLGAGCLLLRLVLESHSTCEVYPKEGRELRLDVAGTFHYQGLRNNRPYFRRAEGGGAGRIVHWKDSRWEIVDDAGELVLASEEWEGPLLGSPWQALEVEAALMPHVRSYSASSFAPRILQDNAPFVGLLNPSSGNRMGAPFLDEFRSFPSYRGRCFNIVHVATRPATLAAFRRRLEVIKDEAERTGNRPRLVCAGGDGTASFAIWCFFKALHFEVTEGCSGLLWSDEELQRFFPALVQMPLGTGNDLAGILGWGRVMDPFSHHAYAKKWLENAFCNRRPVVPFDVWGFFPQGEGPGLKLCQLAGIDENHADRPRFKVAGPSVPFLSLLYYSMGYDAFVAAEVEINRTSSQLLNKLEYVQSGTRALLGAKRRHVDLTGIKVDVPVIPSGSSPVAGASLEERQYFPPVERGSTGSEYATCGCMNINSLAAGFLTASEPAKFGDGLIDLFRQRNYLGNALRRGRGMDTEKHSRATFRIPAQLPGVHIQFDGEARYLFQPEQKDGAWQLRRVMQIPVVLGPESQEIAIGSSAGWVVVAEHDAVGTDMAFIPATHLDECKELCLRHSFGGFCVHDGKAFFRQEKGKALKSKLNPCAGCTTYIRDEAAQDMKFRFTGPRGDMDNQKRRLYDWVSGRLTRELNATKEEVEELQWRCHSYAQGICARSRRAYGHFRASKNKGAGDGGIITFNQCATCGAGCGNYGCTGCRRPFCQKCFVNHKGTAPGVIWMFKDGFFRLLAASPELCLEEAQDKMSELMETQPERPICIRIIVEGKQVEEDNFDNAIAAHDYLYKKQEEDQKTCPQPRTLKTFVQHNARGRKPGLCELPGISDLGESSEEEADSPSQDGKVGGSLENLEDFLGESVTTPPSTFHSFEFHTDTGPSPR